VTRDIRKSPSSLLKHIFSTIPSFTPPSTQNWVCSHSYCLVVATEKISFALRAPFPKSQMSKSCPCTTSFPKKSGNCGARLIDNLGNILYSLVVLHNLRSGIRRVLVGKFLNRTSGKFLFFDEVLLLLLNEWAWTAIYPRKLMHEVSPS